MSAPMVESFTEWLSAELADAHAEFAKQTTDVGQQFYNAEIMALNRVQVAFLRRVIDQPAPDVAQPSEVERLERELTETRRARIGDSEIIGREMCRAEKAEAKVEGYENVIDRLGLDPNGEHSGPEIIERLYARLMTPCPDCAPSGWQQRIAAIESPWRAGVVTNYCFFCGVPQDYKPGPDHKADCLWQNAVDAGQHAKDAISEVKE